MNFNILRNPIIAVVLASLILFASCNQYDNEGVINKKFDYQIFEQAKGQNVINIYSIVGSHLK